jgi:putative FmdB family regulatory protein
MPIYEYSCEACGNRFEKLLRRSDAESADGFLSDAACPSCGKQDLKQEYSTFAARAESGQKAAETGQCPAGMCGNPGMCGRN